MLTLKEILEKKIMVINQYLDKYIENSDGYQKEIFKAMRYSVFAGGKRLRPILLMGAYEAFGGKDLQKVMPFAAALEMIHTYSLIHDDLPAMDNDDYRRGKLTNHKVFGEGMAILAGDALLNTAFETMIKGSIYNEILGIKAMKVIAEASGVNGMIGGQVVDLESEHKQISAEVLNYIHENKTARLIQAPLQAGAILAGVEDKYIELMEKAGYKLGIAFQIQDDILDVIGNEKELGKPIKSDLKNEKVTFVTMYGLEKSKEIVKKYSNETCKIFEMLGENGDFLKKLSQYLIDRKF